MAERTFLLPDLGEGLEDATVAAWLVREGETVVLNQPLVEVETGESVNNLEAMAQWVHFSKARAPFHLYVPVAAFDVARRLCEANGVRAAEIWTYRALLEGFDLVRSFHDPSAASGAPARTVSTTVA